jgi:hypothetical protein
MKAVKEKDRNQLLTRVRQQQSEIVALRGRIEALEAEDVGKLRRRVEELESWKVQAEKQIQQLEAKSAMTQGLVVFAGVSAVALLGEKLVGILNAIPIDQIEELFNEFTNEEIAEIEEKLGKEQVAELEAKLGNFITTVIQTVQRIDKMSVETWQRQWASLEKRATTLPSLKRAMFEALKNFASPSKLGTQLVRVLLAAPEIEAKLTDEDKRKVELLAAVADRLTNLWPLTITNSLAPMLNYVGFDDAAEAAGEILDQLETSGTVPRHLVHKIRHDLVVDGAIELRTKPNTVIEYFKHGFRLQQLGCSPDEAAEFGHIHWSATQLKRAKRAYEGLQSLYNRTREFSANTNLENLETFSQAFKRIAEDKVTELRELVVAELN